MTLRLPEDYRVKGDAYVAIAFFQGEGEIDEVPELDATSRCAQALEDAAPTVPSLDRFDLWGICAHLAHAS